MSDETKVWLTTDEAVALTGYSPHYVRRLVRLQRVTAKKWSHVWMIERQSLLDYKQEMDSLGREKHNPLRGKTTEEDGAE